MEGSLGLESGPTVGYPAAATTITATATALHTLVSESRTTDIWFCAKSLLQKSQW